jgi:phosphoribosylanthranilate isomerase
MLRERSASSIVCRLSSVIIKLNHQNLHSPLKIKICGITQLPQLRELDALGIDYAGLIFYDPSPRYVLNKLSGDAVRALSLSLQKVGVFVNAPEDKVMTQIEHYGLDMVQLHGDETPAYCAHIRRQCPVIKAFRLGAQTSVDWLVQPYADSCDYFLFDTDTKNYGGSGQQFNWQLLQHATIGKPFFLSGGIGVDDWAAVQHFTHPFLHALDLNSKLETKPGVKDMALVQELMKRVGERVGE